MRIIRASFRRGEQVGRWWNIRCRFSLVRGRRALPWSCGGHEKAARAGAGGLDGCGRGGHRSAARLRRYSRRRGLAVRARRHRIRRIRCARLLRRRTRRRRRRHRPRLVAALELGDVSESAGPGSFDHTPAADEASSESEPAEDIAPKPAEDEATGTGEAGTTTEEQSEPTDPAGVEAPSPRGAFTGSEHGHRRRDRRARGRGRRDAVGEVFDFTSNRTWRSRSPVRPARAASRCPT
ncbi:hypothetical protein C8E05_0123 [Rhodococcus wratislaviensis]|uniref:Peptidase M23 family protein n=1 Tax=Rhodococcus wratislaviensis TaxID=44752 RepID=A0AB38F5S6_RHOWR|nr:hypothetical protein C8E05_0123 [Rhodococcus wratislaviensis]SPZ34759.1 peptidase M23 family protein [Rhodococcus wratislaviensis]